MEGLKPFGLWALIALLVGGLIWIAQSQGWIPSQAPFWALGIVAVLGLGFVNLLAKGPK
ncbi:MAG: hypothetical protein SFU83_24315 [Meiothermus sp.]|nr:hypothetical protein [Meiothermus sp.]